MVRGLVGAIALSTVLVGGCSPASDPPSQPIDRAGPSAESSTTDESWDVVVFTHSQGGGLAEAYAPLASEVLGVAVRPHGAAIDYLSAERALEHLSGSRYPPVGDLVRDAEIVVVGIANPMELDDAWGTMCDGHGPRSLDVHIPEVPTRPAMAEALLGFDAELDEIVRLRAGQPTVLFGLAHELGMYSRWQELGIAGPCMEGWELFYEVAGDLVESHGGTMVYTIDAFNGPGHDQPVDGDLLSDGTHLSEAGTRLAAETLATQPIEPVPLIVP